MKTFWVVATLVIAFLIGRTLWMRRDACTVLRRINTEDGVIEIVDSVCKEGLPHTTGPNTIRMTETAYNDPRQKRTLIHERVHLDQRRRRDEWIQFYKREWDYKVVRDPPVSALADARPNPDTEDAPYAIWKDRYVFYPAYSANRTLKGAVVRIWDLKTGAFVQVPEAWRAFFCDGNACVHQYEHPHEIAAEYIAEGSAAPAAQKLFAWKH